MWLYCVLTLAFLYLAADQNVFHVIRSSNGMSFCRYSALLHKKADVGDVSRVCLGSIRL